MIRSNDTRGARKARIRKKITGGNERPRLTVYKSLKHIYAQVVDDLGGKTLAYASDLSAEVRDELKAQRQKKLEVAKRVGKLIAKKCLDAKVDKVVFDRNGFPYQGRIAALAQAARDGGLKF
jgi:large subunit ribosomal protein L18